MRDAIADITAAEVLIDVDRAAATAFVEQPPPWEVAHLAVIAWVTDAAVRHLLLVRHRLHGWSCPGGHVEPDESPRRAAAREVAEETGLVLEPATRPLTLAAPVGCARVPSARHWTLGYHFVADPGQRLTAEDGQDARWFAAGPEIGRDVAPAYAREIDLVLPALRRRAGRVG